MRTSDRTITVGIVGAGGVSRYHARALRSLRFVRVTGVCDVDVKRAAALAEQFGAPAFTNLGALGIVRPDVVHILTPPASHCELTLEALDMGAHVLVEKPMASTADECDRMMKAASQSGRWLSVNHSVRMDPVVLRALELIRQGACGEVVAADFLRSSDYPPYAGGTLPAHYADASYPFRDLGVHGLCLVEAFLGSIRDIELRCFASGLKTSLAWDEWHALVRCEKGMGRVYLSWNVEPIQNELIIHGTKGVMHVDCYLQTCTLRPAMRAPKQAQRVYGAVANSLSTIGEVIAHTARFAAGRLPPSPAIHNSVRAFYIALRNELPPPVLAEEGRRMVGWLDHAVRFVDLHERRVPNPPVGCDSVTPPVLARISHSAANQGPLADA